MSVLCGWWSIGTGCPEKLCSLFLGDLQKPPGHGPGQLVLSVLAWAGFGPDGSRGPFQLHPLCGLWVIKKSFCFSCSVSQAGAPCVMLQINEHSLFDKAPRSCVSWSPSFDLLRFSTPWYPRLFLYTVCIQTPFPGFSVCLDLVSRAQIHWSSRAQVLSNVQPWFLQDPSEKYPNRDCQSQSELFRAGWGAVHARCVLMVTSRSLSYLWTRSSVHRGWEKKSWALRELRAKSGLLSLSKQFLTFCLICRDIWRAGFLKACRWIRWAHSRETFRGTGVTCHCSWRELLWTFSHLRADADQVAVAALLFITYISFPS